MVAGAEIARSSICFEVRFLPPAFGAAWCSGQSMPVRELHITAGCAKNGWPLNSWLRSRALLRPNWIHTTSFRVERSPAFELAREMLAFQPGFYGSQVHSQEPKRTSFGPEG
jgi:hypothetical protein